MATGNEAGPKTPVPPNRKNSASILVSGRSQRSVGCSASRNHMPDFDYLARAELFLGSDWATATSLGHRAFRRAAHALRFAFEEAAPVSLRGARLRIGDRQFAGHELIGLYTSRQYPLPRKRGTTHRNQVRKNNAGHR